MHTLAPDATIESTDEGSKLVGDLAEAVNKFATDHRFAPTVSCGPYSFISFENKQVKLVKNDNFAGTWDKKTPSIETIIVKTVNATLDVDMLVNGEVDIVQGVVEGDKIEKAKALKMFRNLLMLVTVTETFLCTQTSVLLKKKKYVTLSPTFWIKMI